MRILCLATSLGRRAMDGGIRTDARWAEDQALLDAGFETGRWGEDGAPAPWPQDFLDPEAGWVGSEGRAVDLFGAGPCQNAEQKTFAQLIAEHEGDEPPF